METNEKGPNGPNPKTQCKGSGFLSTNNTLENSLKRTPGTLFVESVETEKLNRIISNKKNFMRKQTNKASAQILQSEIIVLEKDILPIVECNTQIFHEILNKHFLKAVDTAHRFDCDAFVVYIPLTSDSEFPESPRVGIYNAKDGAENPGDVFVFIANMGC